MNRRDFLTVAGGVSAASILGASPLLAAEKTTPFYVRGLAMLSLNDPDYLRIGLPKAPHHRATLSVVPKADDRYAVAISGNGELEGIRAAGGNPDLYLRIVVHVRELYKDAISLIDRSPSMISIPWTAIKSVETHSLSKERWTFVRRETEEEVISFRPRKIADSIKIELNDPRQSRGLISVSPSKGPVKRRLKAADAPTPCSAPPNAAPPAPAAKCIPARIVCPSPPWKRNSLALRNSSLSNGVSVPESSGQSRLHSSP